MQQDRTEDARHWRQWYWIGLGAFWLSVILFYPCAYLSRGEAAQVAQARAYAQGGAQAHAHAGAVTDLDSPPGFAILLGPFLRFGLQGTFLLGPLAATLGCLLLARLLREQGTPETFALLFLFHPTVHATTRTLAPDVLVATAFLAGLQALRPTRPRPTTGGFALGLAISLRSAVAPIAALLFFQALLRLRTRVQRLRLCAGLALGAAPFVAFACQPGVWMSLADLTPLRPLLANMLPNLAGFVLSLNLVYPLLLFTGLAPSFREHVLLKSAGLLAIVLFSIRPPVPFDDRLALAVFTQQPFLFFVPWLLLGYAQWLHARVLRTPAAFALLLFVLVASTGLMSARNQADQVERRELARAALACTAPGELVLADDTTAALLPDVLRERVGLDVERIPRLADVVAAVEDHSGPVVLLYTRTGPDARWGRGEALLARYPHTIRARHRGRERDLTVLLLHPPRQTAADAAPPDS